MVIGLTGKFCTGKNRVGSIMEDQGWMVIDVDFLGHEALHRKRDRVADYFGAEYLDERDEVDRRKLADRVFNSPGELAFLESLTHPVMVDMCREMITNRDEEKYPRGTVLNAAVLHKMQLDALCDMILYVKAYTFLRYFRARSTRNMSLRQCIQRDRVQKYIDPKYFSDDIPIYVIMSNHGDKQLKRQLKTLYDHSI